MVNDEKSILLAAQEIKLAKILAGNNKVLRDRTLKRLKKWLDDRTAAIPISDDVFMRIWKGLFYYMWMSDKPLVQEECAEKIAQLVHFKDAKISLVFFRCFLKTMVQEWFGIDHHRIDKFLMLIRRVLRQAFNILKHVSWDVAFTDFFKEILKGTVLHTEDTVALGLTIHISDIYLEELAKVSEGDISNENVLSLVEPFAEQLARAEDKRLAEYITKNIFRYLMFQSDLGMEYQEKFEAWRKAGFPGGRIDKMQKVIVEDEDDDDEYDEMENDEMQGKPLDPRAGKVHVDLPQLKYDSADIAKMLEDLAHKPYTTSQSRAALRQLSNEFKQMVVGKFPVSIKRVPTINTKDYKLNVKSSVKRLEELEEMLKDKTNKKQRTQTQKKKSNKIIDDEPPEHNANDDVEEGNHNGSKDDFEAFVAKSEAGLFDEDHDDNSEDCSIENNNNTDVSKGKEKLKTKLSNGFRMVNDNVEKTPKNKKLKKTKVDNEKNKPECTRKIKNNNLEREISESVLAKKHNQKLKNMSSKNLKPQPNSVTSNRRKRSSLDGTEDHPLLKKQKSENVEAPFTPCQLHKIRKEKKKNSENMFKRNSGVWYVDDLVSKREANRNKGNPESRIEEWNQPQKEGKTDFFVMSRKMKRKLKQKTFQVSTPKTKILKDNIVKNPFSPGSAKKIKFALDLNKSQEIHEHHAKISESPSIPFDASKKPSKPLLKPTSIPSPVNPFYRRKTIF